MFTFSYLPYIIIFCNLIICRFKRMAGEDKKNMAKHICDTYIRANSMQEINLDALARDKILADLGKCTFVPLLYCYIYCYYVAEECPPDIFEEAEREIYMLMKQNSYPIFVISNIYNEIPLEESMISFNFSVLLPFCNFRSHSRKNEASFLASIKSRRAISDNFSFTYTFHHGPLPTQHFFLQPTARTHAQCERFMYVTPSCSYFSYLLYLLKPSTLPLLVPLIVFLAA